MTRRVVERLPGRWSRVESTRESVAAAVLAGPPPVAGWPKGWEDWPEVVEAHRSLFARYLADGRPSEPLPRFEGRGIVMPAGGAVYFQAAYVAISVLRSVGCTLPVEIWYMGPTELDPQMRGLLHQLGGVEFRDALDVRPELRMLSGWGLKPFAVFHTRFAEALLLDADQLLARDPTYLFDDPAYLERGAVLWPDYPSPEGVDCTASFFDVTGLPCPDYDGMPNHDKPSAYRPVESGQLLVDRRRRLPEVWLAAKLCEHADFLWPKGRPAKCYGDKSCWLAAWLMLATHRGEPWSYLGPDPLPFAMPAMTARFIGENKGGAGGFLQYDLAGKLLTLHRCQPYPRKWANRDRLGVPNEDAALAALACLDVAWTGHVWGFGDPETIGGAAGDWLLYRGDQEPRRITLEAGGTIAAGDAKAQRWALCQSPDGPILALSSDGAASFLGRDPAGNWQNLGTGIVLHPAPPAWYVVRDAFDAVAWESINGPKNEYRLPLTFSASDTIVDVGAHVGAFAIACLQRGAGHVVCIEPDAGNLAALRQHLGRYPADRVTILPVAAWRSDQAGQPMSLTRPGGAEHSGGGVPAPSRLATCWAVPFDYLLPPGPIRLLKLDCEGSEYPIVWTTERLADVQEVTGEYHSPKNLPDSEPTASYSPESLAERLEHGGFMVELAPNPQAGGELGNFFARRPTAAV